MSDALEKPVPPLKFGVEAVQFEHEGAPMVLLRDQEGIIDESIAVSLPGFLIATMLNGQTKLSEIQQAFSKATGQLLAPAELQKLIDQLDKAGYLETPALHERRVKVLKDFSASPVRPARHTVHLPSKNLLEMAAYLGKFFKNGKGPGKEFAAAATSLSPARGIFSPHIDFERGGPAYAWAYQALSETAPPDVVIGLGVAHMSPNSPWVFTDKEYETPYGAMKVDRELYDDLKGCLWYQAKADEQVHRTEHSLEFQAFWLRYLWRDKAPAWMPILTSSFERFCPDKAPSTVTTVEEAHQKMGQVLLDYEKKGKRVLILAGIDLAHVGPRFGDELELNADLKTKVEQEDKKSLELAMKGEADAFFLTGVGEHHWRKICGLSAAYTALRLMKILNGGKPLDGKLLTYDQAPDPTGGIVSFAGAIFPR